MSIDWEQQWALHGHNFSNGLVHIDFEAHGTKIVLQPGAGFGDFSHPTTRLVLKMMAPYVSGNDVLDVGSGSGILSIAALGLGARRAFGSQIDKDAIAPAKKNCTLNGFAGCCHFSLPEEAALPKTPVLLMNMIRTEQKMAWEVLKTPTVEAAFTSGIL